MEKTISQIEKNFYIAFYGLCFDEEFHNDSDLIFKKWNLPIEGKSPQECLKNFERRNGKKSVLIFIADVVNLAKKYNLGKNWLDFFGTYFLTGSDNIFEIDFLEGKMPIPNNSFYISSSEKNKKAKTIKIEIGPHTTFSEIKAFWPQIEKMQKSVWPKVKRTKISHRSIDKMILSINLIIERYRLDGETEFYDPEIDAFKVIAQQTNAMIANKLLDSDDDETNITQKDEKRMADRIRQITHRDSVTK